MASFLAATLVALCVPAGWHKLKWIVALAFQAGGRCARYWLVAQGAALL